MASQANGTSSEATEGSKEKPNETVTPPKAAAETQPKLSNAELKAKAKAEKAARRAQNKDGKATQGPAGASSAARLAGSEAPPAESKGGKGGRPKQDGASNQQSKQQQPGQQQPHRHGSTTSQPPQRRPSLGRRPSFAAREVGGRSSVPDCFSHLPMAKRISTTQAHKDVHPAVLALGQQMATFTIRDSISRLEGTLLAFRKVLEEYETPEGDAMTRHFVSHVLNPQIEYLTECRPMSFAMGNAIRLLKANIRKFDINTPQDEAKEGLLETIDDFISERITLAELVIARNAADMIANGDRVLVFGRHRLVEKTLLQSWREGNKFHVHVVDDPYEQTGQDLAKSLRRENIRVSYTPNLAGLSTILQATTKVLLGTEAMFANGSLYGPVGTCDVAMAARDLNVPVIALCETINFDHDRVATDSLAYNEIDPERCSGDAFRLLFDTTPSSCISVVVSEYESETGNAPPASILSILRKQEDPSAS